MPDWEQLVREHLATRGLSHSAEEDVIAELAAHLEDSCEQERTRGRSAAEARKRALANIEWRQLARRIRAAKCKEDEMNQRTRSLWMPAMVNLLVAPGLLMILQKLGVHPRVVWVGDMALVLYLPWLVTLPVFGAAGAFLAKRAQASSLHRLVVGLAPALAILGSFAVMLPLSLAIGTAHLSGFPWVYFALTIFNWVVLPSLALLAGTLPLLRKTDLRRA